MGDLGRNLAYKVMNALDGIDTLDGKVLYFDGENAWVESIDAITNKTDKGKEIELRHCYYDGSANWADVEIVRNKSDVEE